MQSGEGSAEPVTAIIDAVGPIHPVIDELGKDDEIGEVDDQVSILNNAVHGDDNQSEQQIMDDDFIKDGPVNVQEMSPQEVQMHTHMMSHQELHMNAHSMTHHDEENVSIPSMITREQNLMSMGSEEVKLAGGKWSDDEHQRFLEGLAKYSKGKWKDIASVVGTRTAEQTRTHGRKYFDKLKRWEEKAGKDTGNKKFIEEKVTNDKDLNGDTMDGLDSPLRKRHKTREEVHHTAEDIQEVYYL